MTIYVGTSWKMNKLVPEALAFVEELNAFDRWPSGVVPFVLPPHTALHALSVALEPATGVLLGAQNAHWAPSGAYTGEVSMEMVRDAGAAIIEIGHSERRDAFNETDTTVALKVEAALRAGMRPLVCVGEPSEVRDAGGATAFVVAQAEAALERIPRDERRRVLIAYEPVWAIGEGGRPASPGEVKEQIVALAGVGAAAVLYGGSVDQANAGDMLRLPGIGGVFVGRSAWKPQGFLRLVQIAGEQARARTAAAL